MTQFLGTTSGSDGGIPFRADDVRLWPEWADADTLGMNEVPVGQAFYMEGWKNAWWPRGQCLDASGNEMLESLWYDRPEMSNGMNSRLGITGITYDKFGTPVGGVTCKLFRTTGDLYKDVKIDETTSNSVGGYVLSTPFFPDQHYIVFYKAGSPDIYGSSPNTLIGS